MAITRIKKLNEELVNKYEEIEELVKSGTQWILKTNDGEFPLNLTGKISEVADKLLETNSFQELLERFETDETDEEIDINDQFENINEYIDMIATGNSTSLVVAGPGGIGKSVAVYSRLDEKGIDYTVIKGYTSPAALFQTLSADPLGTFVFDDCDSIWFNDASLNILKSVLDEPTRGKKGRIVSWNLNKNNQSFEFLGRIIFLSNLDFFKIKQNAQHVSAVMTRVDFVQVTSEPQQVFNRIATIAEQIESDKETRDFILDYLNKYKFKARLSLRLFNKLIRIYKTRPHRFNSMAKEAIRAQKLEA